MFQLASVASRCDRRKLVHPYGDQAYLLFHHCTDRTDLRSAPRGHELLSRGPSTTGRPHWRRARQNSTMEQLTILATVLLPLTSLPGSSGRTLRGSLTTSPASPDLPCSESAACSFRWLCSGCGCVATDGRSAQPKPLPWSKRAAGVRVGAAGSAPRPRRSGTR